ncbi:hypothetical protein ACFOD4_16400 [Pseudoroseomonas globiformis]|uniref:Secreted protein n=1 Tax=Teichococcus globiformis TaxID=2307229 RepID=A0ABV7G1S2_9PROT
MRRLRQLAMIGLAAAGLVLGTAAALPGAAKAAGVNQPEVLLVHDGWRRGPPPRWHHRHQGPPRGYYGPPPRYYHRPPPVIYQPPPRAYYPPPPPRYYRPAPRAGFYFGY